MTAKPFYYLINYRAYPEGTKIQTLNQALREAAKAELQKSGQTLTALPEAHSVGLQESARLEPGATLELKLPAGPGAIREFTVKLPAAAVHPEILRSTVVARTHDGEETVWCPLGDLFCSADALHPIHTWQRTVADDGTMVCRWVMPYRASAAVRLLNLCAPAEVVVQVVTSSWAWDERSMHFHANWRPDDVVHGTPFQDWNFIDIRGQGVLVGDAWTVLNVQGSWWGEGDEKIYVDDAWDGGFPTHFGTGTEDYYGWAGGEVPTRRDEFSLPFLANARVAEAIEKQRPQGERHMTTAEWLIYNILDLKFVQGMRVRDIAQRLAMSEADLYRKQRLAIEEVARALREMESTGTTEISTATVKES